MAKKVADAVSGTTLDRGLATLVVSEFVQHDSLPAEVDAAIRAEMQVREAVSVVKRGK